MRAAKPERLRHLEDDLFYVCRAALPDRFAREVGHERPFPGALEGLDDGSDEVTVLVYPLDELHRDEVGALVAHERMVRLVAARSARASAPTPPVSARCGVRRVLFR